MADFLIHATISNLIVSAVLAGLAWAFQRSERSVVIANLLWTIVLIKMVTPPLFSLPMIEVEHLSPFVQAQDSIVDSARISVIHSGLPLNAHGPFAPSQTSVGANSAVVNLPTNPVNYGTSSWVGGMILGWIAVSAILLIVSLIRVVHFEILLRRNSRLAPEHIKKIAKDLSVKMGLRTPPLIVISNAHIAPFVWWLGGRPRIIISSSAGQVLDDDELQMVLAHEMAHLRRRDHWIRWVECLAGVIAWWNPLLWWTRRHLRITEEVACDELVIEKLRPERNDYAKTLLNMAELLSTSATCPPAVASGINSGGLLEQRLTKVMSRKNIINPAWLRPAIMLVATCVVPLGLVYAQDYEAVERRLGSAVEAGELTIDQAKIMFDALKQSPSTSQDLENRKRRYMGAARAIEAAVAEGKLNKEDAEQRLIALRMEMFGQDDSNSRDDRDLEGRKHKYMEVARQIEAAVEDGKISKEAAEKRLIALRVEMFRQGDSKDRDDSDLEAKKRKYMEAAREIQVAVEAGKATKEDAEKRLIEMRKRMFKQDDSKDRDNRDMEAKKLKLMEVAREIEAAVEDGKISKEDAEKKLIALRMEMFRQDDSNIRDDRDMEGRKRQFMDVARAIQVAAAEGKISKEDAEKRIIALRMEMFEQGDSNGAKQPDRINHKQAVELARELEAAVRAGKVSKEDAKKRLIGLRQEMFNQDSSRDRGNREMEAKKHKYMEVAREIEAAVADGKMTKEDAEKRLIALRKEMFKQDASEDRK